ncbi:IS21 family transposase, partial [Acidimicrobiaceae bacterium USS-CC1]|nr:IS21 family transposase [Acidiferrimicrobium australe]
MALSFREVGVHEVREVLRLWLRGESERENARLARVDRKTVNRYVTAGIEAGLVCDGGEGQLTDGLIAAVCERVRPHRPDSHGAGWAMLRAHHEQLKVWLVDEGLTVVKAHELLARQGVVVAQRSVHRYALEVLGVGRSARRSTVPVADGEPGAELQVDFGKMGLLVDTVTQRRRVCWALILTACYSRHCFVWLSFTQTTEAVIAGFEAAWGFFGGVFKVVIPDNMSSAITTADKLEPRFNQAFIEYAQARGFVVDPARVRSPQDKPRVERTVPFVRNSFFAGETFVDLADAQRRAVQWCMVRAGQRVHGTHACRPVELFDLEERPRLLPAPGSRYDLPIYATAKVHRDHHIEVARALYSIPGNLIGAPVEVRADSQLVRVFHRGALIKVHPRQAPGRRVTDPADLPAERTVYAMRDLDHLRRLAAAEGPAIGAYASALLDTPLPWTKMRQVYALLGLVKRWGAPTVEAACARALDAEAI